MTLRDDLERLGACPPARKWVGERTDPTEVWRDCPRGSWLAWVLVRTARTDAERREALGVVCAVVRELSPPRDPASERALSLAEAWCRGKRVSRRDLHNAAAAAYTTAYTASYAAYASYAASYAASSYAAASSARAATSAASARAVSADAIRRRLPEPPAWVLAACEVLS